MKQIISYGNNSASAMLKGIDVLMHAAKGAYGPTGHCSLIEQYSGSPIITQRGYEIVKSIELPDPVEDSGAAIFRKLADEVNEAVGDGTTASLIIADKIIRLGFLNISAGASPVLICNGIKKALAAALEALDGKSCNDSPENNVYMTAASAAKDSRIGRIVAEAFEKVNYRGMVSTRFSPNEKSYVQHDTGLIFDRGYYSPYMSTDMSTMEAVLDEPYVLLCNKKIETIEEILPLLNEISLSSTTLFIICDDIADSVLSSFLSNIYQQTIKICAAKTPGFGLYRRNYLEDIAALTGTRVYGTEFDPALNTVTMVSCGRAKKVVVTKDSTSIYGGAADMESIAAYVKTLEHKIGSDLNQLEREKLRQRIANLTDGTSVIRAGAASESEKKFVKTSIETAIRAAEHSLSDGYVPGGASTAARISLAVREFAEGLSDEEKTGALILADALTQPLKELSANCGAEPQTTVAAVISAPENFGFNGDTGRIENILEAGLADPAIVVKTGIEKAVSAAVTFLSVGASISARVIKMKAPENVDDLNIHPSDFM